MGAKNGFGAMPVQDIDPDVLEEHLDNCVEFDVNSKKQEKEEFSVKLNYRSLIPPYATLCSEVDENGQCTRKELVAETEVIYFMSKTSEYKHLLSHPVIVSFLFMKWLRLQWLFWVNLCFYVIFALSLVTYIFFDFAYFSQEQKSALQSSTAKLSYVVLIVSLLLLILREFFQICVAPLKYLANFENYIEIVLIVVSSFMVFTKSPTDDARKQLASVSILLAAFELVLMLGQHPHFSTNVVMLRTVSFNFFKFFIWYSLLIIAFALSFFLLFNETSSNEVMVRNATQGDEEDDKSFSDPGRSVFRTIVMLTGEFDASSIKFDTFPITSKLIFALFIFMIAIILLNLLNGLAVSDTQMIKSDAELVGHIARAEYIRYVETMFLGNILPTNLMSKLNEICCCFPCTEGWNLRINRAFAEKACLFPKQFNYELEVYPNKQGAVETNVADTKGERKSCVPCATVNLDRDTIRRTNGIVKARMDKCLEDDKMEKMNERLVTLQQKMDEILTRLNTINK